MPDPELPDLSADALNEAMEGVTQDALRRMAQRSVRAGGPQHFFSNSDTFDTIPGMGLVVRRNNHTKPLGSFKDGEYGG